MPRRIRYRNPDIHGHLHQLATGKIVYVETAEICTFCSKYVPTNTSSCYISTLHSSQDSTGARWYQTTLHYTTLHYIRNVPNKKFVCF